MVGHTGRVSAARCAVEEVDACLGDLLDAIGESPEWVALVTADHGNCEMMIDAEGNVHTAHTTEPVDFVVVDPQGLERHISGPGKLADVAPTVLDLMGIDAPAQMTGASLLTEAAGEDLD
jgi:2,3-bisphosphoglycerate-independent phosphoglycerate mutase